MSKIQGTVIAGQSAFGNQRHRLVPEPEEDEVEDHGHAHHPGWIDQEAVQVGIDILQLVSTVVCGISVFLTNANSFCLLFIGGNIMLSVLENDKRRIRVAEAFLNVSFIAVWAMLPDKYLCTAILIGLFFINGAEIFTMRLLKYLLKDGGHDHPHP